MTDIPIQGRGWARCGFFGGIGASLAGNVAHTLVLTHNAGAVVASAYWPLALLIALEIIARVSWPLGARWWVLRYGGLTTVAAIAAIISYSHMAALLSRYGEGVITAHLGPAAVDGLMVVSSTALLAIADNLRRRPAIGTVEQL
jgi:Protein of unknown function (DUF2637)